MKCATLAVKCATLADSAGDPCRGVALPNFGDLVLLLLLLLTGGLDPDDVGDEGLEPRFLSRQATVLWLPVEP